MCVYIYIYIYIYIHTHARTHTHTHTYMHIYIPSSGLMAKEQMKRTKRKKVFADMERYGTSTILSCIFNLLRDYGCIVGLANQSCVRGSLCLDSTALRLRCSYNNSLHSSFR